MINILKFIYEKILDTNFFTGLVAIIAILIAYRIGLKQNEINEKIGKLQDSVELYTTFAIKQTIDDNNKIVSQIPAIHIQNVGTRLVYFDRYSFNGKVYELNKQVRPPTYSNAENNFYWIELPTNEEKHVSLFVDFTDIDGRHWRSKIFADKKENLNWEIKTFPREELK